MAVWVVVGVLSMGAIAVVVAITLGGFPHVLLNGIGMHAGIEKPIPVLPGRAQRFRYRPKRCRIHQSAVGDDQRAPDRKLLTPGDQFRNGAGAVEGWGWK